MERHTPLDSSEEFAEDCNINRKGVDVASWRVSVLLCAAFATCVLIANVLIVNWAKIFLGDTDKGVATVFKGIRMM